MDFAAAGLATTLVVKAAVPKLSGDGVDGAVTTVPSRAARRLCRLGRDGHPSGEPTGQHGYRGDLGRRRSPIGRDLADFRCRGVTRCAMAPDVFGHGEPSPDACEVSCRVRVGVSPGSWPGGRTWSFTPRTPHDARKWFPRSCPRWLNETRCGGRIRRSAPGTSPGGEGVSTLYHPGKRCHGRVTERSAASQLRSPRQAGLRLLGRPRGHLGRGVDKHMRRQVVRYADGLAPGVIHPLGADAVVSQKDPSLPAR